MPGAGRFRRERAVRCPLGPQDGVGVLENGRPLSLASRPYTARAIIIFLISAMAFAGLSPFGQALAQFMMVWQR